MKLREVASGIVIIFMVFSWICINLDHSKSTTPTKDTYSSTELTR